MELADTCGSDPNVDPEDYVPTTLATKLKSRQPIEPQEISRITFALTSALAFLHQQALLHRDIKPSNIIFVKGQPKLADIGLVAGADETHSFVGTEGYIPPEGPGTPAADVFSLGKVLSELLAQTTFSGAAESATPPIRHVIERACARKLDLRYQTAQEMLHHLRATLGNGSSFG
jgi:serine/threonine protein kinase